MRLDDIPAAAWREAVGTVRRSWGFGTPIYPNSIAKQDGALDAIRQIVDQARRIAEEMAEQEARDA